MVLPQSSTVFQGAVAPPHGKPGAGVPAELWKAAAAPLSLFVKSFHKTMDLLANMPLDLRDLNLERQRGRRPLQ